MANEKPLMNILIVDNNAIWLETLNRGLNINGHQVVEAMSANEALMNLSDPDTPGIESRPNRLCYG